MFETIAAWLLGGGVVTLFVDGVKQLSKVYDNASGVWKHALVWAASVVLVLAFRGFDLPDNLFGWIWMLVVIGIIGVTAYGWFRTRRLAFVKPVEPMIAAARPRTTRTRRPRIPTPLAESGPDHVTTQHRRDNLSES